MQKGPDATGGGLAEVIEVAQRGEQDLGLQLRGWGLNNSQFDVLAHVGANEGIVQQELADSLLVTKGNVAQLVGRMERRGLVERRPAGRTNRLFLTGQGRKLFDEVVPAHETHIAERLSVLSKQEQRRLLDLLRKLDHALDGKRPSGDESRGLPR